MPRFNREDAFSLKKLKIFMYIEMRRGGATKEGMNKKMHGSHPRPGGVSKPAVFCAEAAVHESTETTKKRRKN